MSGTLRVLWTQKVWAPLLSTLRPPLSGEEAGGSEPLPAGLRHEGGGLNALKQDKTGTGNSFFQLPPSHCLFSTSRVSTSETLSSWFSSKTGHSFIHSANPHLVFTLCQTLCWSRDKWGIVSVFKVRRGKRGGKMGNRKQDDIILAFTRKALSETGSEKLSKWPRDTQHERSWIMIHHQDDVLQPLCVGPHGLIWAIKHWHVKQYSHHWRRMWTVWHWH